MSEHDHEHDHDPITSDGEPRLRRVCARSKRCWSKRASCSGRTCAATSTGSSLARRPTEPGSSPARGSIRSSSSACSTDARAAANELDLDSGPSPVVIAVENTESVHHMVVCTLCSCYPRALLGPPPDWYKSLPYRSRAVSDPHGVLAEFGVELDEDVELRVLDSTADVRYLVLPRRPAGSEELSESELAELVTRDSMIGVAQPSAPAHA